MRPGDIGTVFGIGRNYSEHARELGNPVPKEPVVFLKPRSSICSSGAEIPLPSKLGRVDPEVELVLRIGQSASPEEIDKLDPWRLVAGVAIGIDVTARDVQTKAKAAGLPWVMSKGLYRFAPVSEAIDPRELDRGSISFELSVNGTLRQSGNSNQMIFSIPDIVRFLGRTTGLTRDDLVFTGTPAGVGPASVGDKLHARIIGGPELTARFASSVD